MATLGNILLIGTTDGETYTATDSGLKPADKADAGHNHDGVYDAAGAASTVQVNLSSHTGNTGNPHSVTAAQAGAIATTARGAANGVAGLDENARVPISQLPAALAHNRGYYATQVALEAAYPTAAAGDFTTIGETDTVWIWDADTEAWVDSGAGGTVVSVNGQTGTVILNAGDVGAAPAAKGVTSGDSHDHNGGDGAQIAYGSLSGVPSTFAPAAHKTSHQSGGTDAIKLDDLAAPDDNPDLNVSTSAHGLVPKAPNDITKFLRGDATWATAGLPAWSDKTTTYTATAGDRLLANSSGGAFTITLPASPSVGNEIEICDPTGSWATYNVTVARNGSNIESTASDLALNAASAHVRLIYIDGTIGWVIREVC